MASGQPANVQAYLNKHKITQLFEELTALLAKELPAAPLDFLIQKLQMRKKKVSTTTTSTRIPTSPAATKKKPLAVSGTGVGGASRPATVSTTAARKPTQEPRKPSSTDGAPSKLSASRTVGAKGASPSKLKPPSDSKRPNTAPTRPAGGAGSAPVSAGKRPAPSTSRSAAAASGKGSSSSIPPPGRGKRPPATSTGSKVPARKKPETGKPPPTKTVPKPAAAAAPAKSLPAVAVATPPLPALSLAAADAGGDSDEEEQITEVGAREREYDSSGDDDVEEGGQEESKEELDFNLLLARMRRSRQPKGRFLKQHLTTLLESDTAFPGSVVEEEEESEGESGLEMVEGASDLEEEGVVLSEEKRHLARKLPTAPLVSMQVIVCARCTRIISREDDETSLATDSAAAVQSSQTTTDEFESVSQAAGHVSFPQWESGPELTVHQKWMLSGKQPQPPSTRTQPPAGDSGATPESHPLIPLTDGPVDELLVDTSGNDQEEVGNEKETQPGAGLSDTLIEFSSEDTWKGVAPLSRPLIPPTDEESDLLLPTPMNYQKEVDDEEATPQPEVDLSDTLTEPSSEDTWKGIMPTTRPLVPLGDDESDLILPTPVDYQKEEEQEDDEEVQTGGDELSGTLVDSSSTDTWKGVTPMTRPLVPPSDEDSELILPTPVEYRKEEEEEDEEEGSKEDEEVQNGGDDLSETLVETSSTDVWKGITPTPHVPFPTSDESDLLLPEPIQFPKDAEEEEVMDWS